MNHVVSIQYLSSLLDKPVVNFTVVTEGDGDYVTSGKDLHMYCSASGFPSPKISLYTTTQNSTLQEMESSMNQIHYTISNIQPKDTSRYICSASNIAGTSNEEKQITVRCELRVFFLSLCLILLCICNFQYTFLRTT